VGLKDVADSEMQPREQDQFVAFLNPAEGVFEGGVDVELRPGCALNAWLGASARACSVERTTPIA
jgi:hypothetical protein